MSTKAAKIALDSAAAAAGKGGQKIDWDGLTKAVRGATKAGDGIDWNGLSTLIVSDTARKEFADLRRAFNDVNQQLQTKFSMEAKPIDWEYYKKGIGENLVNVYKQGYESIQLPKFVDTVTPQYQPKFDALLKDLKEAGLKAQKESERLEKEIAEVQELKRKMSTMTADEYFERYPELKKKFDDEIRNDFWGY